MLSRMITEIGLLLFGISLTPGCATAPIPPTYTQEERRATCLRTNGCWRANLLDGYCEYKF